MVIYSLENRVETKKDKYTNPQPVANKSNKDVQGSEIVGSKNFRQQSCCLVSDDSNRIDIVKQAEGIGRLNMYIRDTRTLSYIFV